MVPPTGQARAVCTVCIWLVFKSQLGVLFCFFKNDLELVAATRFFAHISSYSAASPLEWGQGDGGLAGSQTAAG